MNITIEQFYYLMEGDHIRQFEADDFYKYYIDRLGSVYLLNRSTGEVVLVSLELIEVKNRVYYTIEVSQQRFQEKYMN